MELILLAFAGMLLVTAYNNTYAAMFQQLKADGPGFAVWGGAVLALYFVSKIPHMDVPARLLLGLVILVFFISNQGIFANFANAVTGQTAPVTPQQVQQPTPPAAIPVDISGGSGSSNPIGKAVDTGTSFLKAVPIIGGLLS